MSEFPEQRFRVESIADNFVSFLAGRSSDFIFDADPPRRLCLGVLSPVQDDNEDPARQRRTRAPNQPTSLGFNVQLEPHTAVNALLSVSFAVYYRVFPSFEEQRTVTRGPSDENSSRPTPSRTDQARYRQKYRKLVVTVTDQPIRSASVGALEATQAQLGLTDALARARATAMNDPNVWRVGQRSTFPRDALSSADRFLATRSGGDPDVPEWRIRLLAEHRHVAGIAFLALSVENISQPTRLEDGCFFDVKLTCRLINGQFKARTFELAAQDFRYSTVSWGRGVNCVLDVSSDRQTARSFADPRCWQPRLATRNQAKEYCRAASLAESDTFACLSGIRHWLASYLDNWERAVPPAGHEAAWKDDVSRFTSEVQRYDLGVKSLIEDSRLLRAFQLANAVAARQFARKDYDTWRLFQIVFIVSMLPSLIGRERPNDEPWHSEAEAIDILWFPTGGGKTEAFFGLILTAIFYDRLRGKHRGPTAWLRYPLRMLSVQQLQRLVDFIADAEDIRREHTDVNVGDPLLVGFFAGLKNSPNDLTRKSGPSPIDRLARDAPTQEGQRRLRLLQSCPYCHHSPPNVEVSTKELRLFHVCPRCKRRAPIVFSDAEVYRYAPVVIVGTVDRLARIGETERFRQALGLIDYQCPDHGYSINRECVEGRCARRAAEFKPVPPTRDPLPTIMLQDELHLLKESLGTYDAHFETLIDLLSELVNCPLPPKRIAATATIEGFERHVAQLYGPKRARRFPVKGRELWDSAYTEIDKDRPEGRLYVGLLPMGRNAREVVQDFTLFAAESARQHWTNSDGDPDPNRDFYDLVLAYANEKRTAADLGSSLANELDLVVLTGDKPMDDVRGTIDRILTDVSQPYEKRLKAVIATSLISHGVDLERFNLMAFIGFPGKPADYIQASSRVGRVHVGLVVTVYRPWNLLERSGYGYFYEYHERLYQLVDPVPIARFSKGAFTRTLSGMYSALLLNVIPVIPNHPLRGRSLQRGAAALEAYRDGTLTDAEISALLQRAYGLSLFNLPTDVCNAYTDLINASCRSFRNQLGQRDDWSLPSRLSPKVVSSLREVDEQVDIGVHRESIQLLSKIQRT